MSCMKGLEKTCDSYPVCHGCNSFISTYFNTYYETKETKDNMKLSDISINIGNKTYPAKTVNYIQTPGSYPNIEVIGTLDPYCVIYRSAYPTRSTRSTPAIPTITNVIFNPPATIVFWSDRTKTVVKCDYEEELYDPEKGIAMAIAKKLIGDNNGAYYNVFKHWLTKWDEQLDKAYNEFDSIETYIDLVPGEVDPATTFSCIPGEAFVNGYIKDEAEGDAE